jgi:hypothetical protein
MIVTLVSEGLVSVFEYLARDLSDLLLYLFVACSLILAFACIGALVHRRWKDLVLFSATLVIAYVPLFGIRAHLEWLSARGFLLHASPVREYLSARCKLVDFVENGIKQTVGECEGVGGAGGREGSIMYDTTGELLQPVSHRPQAWRNAMSGFYSDEILNRSEQRTTRIFGDFYNVTILDGLQGESCSGRSGGQ